MIKNLKIIVGKYNSIGRILDCDSKGYEFKSRFLPIFLVNRILTIKSSYFFKFGLIFLNNFSKTSFKIFNEGFLIDFVQKKTIHTFFKKSILLTFFVYNDKFIFEKIVFSMIDTNIWVKNKKSLFLIKSPSFMINTLITTICSVLLMNVFF